MHSINNRNDTTKYFNLFILLKKTGNEITQLTKIESSHQKHDNSNENQWRNKNTNGMQNEGGYHEKVGNGSQQRNVKEQFGYV